MSQVEPGENPQSVECSRCRWRYLIPDGQALDRCPNCWSELLTPVTSTEIPVDIGYAELVMPFTLDSSTLIQHVAEFASGIPFAPFDLKAEILYSRIRRVFMPAWLVDVDVEAIWDAEIGFNYQVVSHQDQYDENRGGWTSQKVNENRVRWESRWGTIKRSYDNVTAPALESQPQLARRLGGFAIETAHPYSGDDLKDAVVRQPDRNHQEAWQVALPALQGRASDECRLAAGADHVRQFKWSPAFNNHNWSLMLMPVYATYYLDDAGIPKSILIYGQSGQVFGQRTASIKRAQRATLLMLGIAVVLFVMGGFLSALGVVLPPVMVLGGGLMILALLTAIGAVFPVGVAWGFNRKMSRN